MYFFKDVALYEYVVIEDVCNLRKKRGKNRIHMDSYPNSTLFLMYVG